MDSLSLLTHILQTKTYKNVAADINVAVGTIKRWELLNNIPNSYYFDLMKLAEMEIDYSLFTFKEKDQFFTPSETANYCYLKSNEIIETYGDDVTKYTYVEPSAGNGNFLKMLPPNRRIGMDIEPRDEEVIERDFLDWTIDEGQSVEHKYIVIGNPPFGLRGHLALKFINHAAQFSDFVCFVLPQLFDSNGKGSCKSRVKGMNLIYSEVVDSAFYYPGGKDVSVNVVFQIWANKSTVHYKLEEEDIDLTNIIKLYSLSDGGTPGSTRNKQHLYSCDFYLPSTCFGSDAMTAYDNFENLPHRRGYGIIVQSYIDEIKTIMNETDWSAVAFSSTNGAFNLRFDIIQRHIWSHLSSEIKGKNKKPIVTSFM